MKSEHSVSIQCGSEVMEEREREIEHVSVPVDDFVCPEGARTGKWVHKFRHCIVLRKKTTKASVKGLNTLYNSGIWMYCGTIV